MGDKDITEIMQALGEVRQSQGKIWDAVNDLRVLVAGNYVTKTDCEKHMTEIKKETKSEIEKVEKEAKNKVPAWLVVALPIMTGIIVGLIVNAVKG